MKEIPHKVADLIAQYVPPKEYIKLLLVCKEWSNAFAAVMYNSPPLNHPDAFEQLMSTFKGFHPYNKYIQRLNISGAAADNIYMGDLELCLKECTNLKAFKLERCYHISNMVIESIAKHCQNLEELELPGCPFSDTFIPQLSHSLLQVCKIDFSYTNISGGVIPSLITNCLSLTDLIFSDCQPTPASTEEELKELNRVVGVTRPLQVLDLRNTQVTDPVLRYVATTCPQLRVLILENSEISDSSMMKIATQCPNLEVVDVSFCNSVTDLTIQVLTIRATQKESKLVELHLSACDSISPNIVHQFVKKAPRLELLVLDGCEKMQNSIVKEKATHKDDITCTLEARELMELARVPLEKARRGKEVTEKVEPESEFVETPQMEKRLSRTKSRSLLARRSMMNMRIPEAEIVEMALEERTYKIKQRQSIKAAEKPKTPVDEVIERGRKLSVRKSMNDLSIKKPEQRVFVMPVHHEVDEKKVRPKLNIHSAPFISKQLQPPILSSAKSHISPPSSPVETQSEERILLAAGRRRTRSRQMSATSVVTNGTVNSSRTLSSKSSSISTYSWGQDPEVWNNPTQLTANSSTWSQKEFVDPWASKPTPAVPSVTKPKWSPERRQTYGGWSSSRKEQMPIVSLHPKPKGEFQFSQTNRGRLLVKLKVEIKSGGHQELSVHEYDDPTKLATEFCQFWGMNDFKAPLVRLITIRKNHAMRSSRK